MNRCLRTPELLQLICNQVPNNTSEDRQRLLAVALSCRALLEPALDRLWYKMTSFKALMTTLPNDLWSREIITPPGTSNPKFPVVGLLRPMKNTDLTRYLSYYAPRIHEIDLEDLSTTFTLEVWQALQALTNWKPGALTPSARKVAWVLAPRKATIFKRSRQAVVQAFPYFVLFVGSPTKSLHITLDSGVPLQFTSARSAPNLPHSLEEFSLQDTGAYRTTHIHDYIYQVAFRWDNLKVLKVGSVGHAAYKHLSLLPCLFSLTIHDLSGDWPHHDYQGLSDSERPKYLDSISPGSFPSLEVLSISSPDVSSFTDFLQQLPPGNRVHTLKCQLTSTCKEDELFDCFRAIEYHCNPQTLRNFVLKETTDITVEEDVESLDIDTYEGIDIAALFRFPKLENVSINFSEPVNLMRAEIQDIAKSWPNLVKLKIDVDFPNSRIPMIDHEDILTLLYSCPRLKRLGLRFDATRINGNETPANPVNDIPGPLEKLWVANSPIYSPMSVSIFLDKHCPKVGRNIIPFSAKGVPHFVPMALYTKRWVKAREEYF
ncbi:hypothetical protein DFP72DRAFT_472458 [Ephemerocybe angulata]|uniref:F-box domain-containing protein n=1 Tax=Ephemerocybe angulata TaxID=980116 RepID=A0A8H6HR60_9AGAR|nr:hypothetical protein DFP72DRAFT_472458 [Tulosesus angulatus]